MNRFPILLFLASCGYPALAQDYRAEFHQLLGADQMDAIPPLLAKWQAEKPDDAEMYIAKFNYYFRQSRSEMVKLSREPGDGQQLTLTDSAGQTAGYMYSEIVTDDSLFAVARRCISEGIQKHPRRLDMHFGYLYALREAGYLQDHVAELIKVIGFHTEEKRDWRWSGDEPIADVEEMFTGSVQDYIAALFNLDDGPYIEGIRAISQRMIPAYPARIENYSNLGVCSLIEEEYDEALNWFRKANAIDSKDAIVLGNIAYTYSLKGDRKLAIRYYEDMAKYGDKETAADAKERIKALKEKK